MSSGRVLHPIFGRQGRTQAREVVALALVCGHVGDCVEYLPERDVDHGRVLPRREELLCDLAFCPCAKIAT